MSNDIATKEHTARPILPMNIEEAFRLAKAFALAEMLPKSYMQGTPEKAQAMAFTAMQLGAEVGMSPMQSIQSIAVVNGMPSIWGDAQKALVISSGLCEYIKETYSGEPYNDDFKAICTVKRKGQEEVSEEFSVADAKKASLWGKTGTWTQYPKRMIKYRARSFALRDAFPDVLKGLTHSAEELDGMVDVTPEPKTRAKKERKQADEINDILAAKTGVPVELYEQEKERETEVEIDSDGVITEPEDKLANARAAVAAAQQKDLLPIEKTNEHVVADAARSRMQEIKTMILSMHFPEKLREYVRKNESHIIVMPESLAQELQEAIDTQKEKLGIPPGENLLGG